MKISMVTGLPDRSTVEGLDRFERQFQYPLGTHDTFRISHGPDYSRFFRAMGKGAVFLAAEEHDVIGTLGVAERWLRTPSGERIPVCYAGDLKVATSARSKAMVAFRLLRSGFQTLGQRSLRGVYAVVMAGTAKTPDLYTGRAGLPQLGEIGRLNVLRIATSPESVEFDALPYICEHKQLRKEFANLATGSYAPIGGVMRLRSKHRPQPLASPDGSACGLVEDTLRAKRLIASSGNELLSAHLSRFAFAPDKADAGAGLIKAALRIAHQRGFPALFVALDRHNAEILLPWLSNLNVVEAPAIIYGYGFPSQERWIINSAEI